MPCNLVADKLICYIMSKILSDVTQKLRLTEKTKDKRPRGQMKDSI